MRSGFSEIYFTSKYYRPKKFSLMMFMSVFYFALMGFQLIKSMKIDAYELSQSRVDLVGYWLGFLVSCILILWLFRKGRLMLSSIGMVVLLLLYITSVHLFTAPSDSLKSFMMSRYGILMWFILGLGFSAVLSVFQERRNILTTKTIIFLILNFLGILSVVFAISIIQVPVITLSYQSVATSSTILLLMFACTLNCVWGRDLPLFFTCLYVAFATVIVSAVVLLQSTGIVIIWLGIVFAFLGQKIIDSRPTTIFFMVTFLITLGYVFTQSQTFELLSKTTRFATFFVSEGEFSSLTSRLKILSTFFEQFDVSPVFGHFKAQVVAGFDEGHFIHSLPFSFLTHTGLIGTILICLVLFNLLNSRSPWRRGLDPSEYRLAFLMWIILGLGSISTFMTWSVFWFMLGVMCRRPVKLSFRNCYASNN